MLLNPDNQNSKPRNGVIMLHKPKGVVVTRADERGRKTVYDILPDWARADGFVPVGRLDADSRGLLLLATDGKIVERLTRPGACVKTYEVWVRGHVADEHLGAIRRGVETPAGVLSAVQVEIKGFVAHKTRLIVELDEGRNRHIRRMFGALRDGERGTPLKTLEIKRVKIGPLELDVPSGKWRFLTDAEIASLIAKT